MADQEIIYLRGESGQIEPIALPLPDGIAHRLAKGEIRRVNEDGTDVAAAIAQVTDPDGNGDAPGGDQPNPDGGEVPTGTVAQVLDWVGDDTTRARRALEVEQSKGAPARSSLATALHKLLDIQE